MILNLNNIYENGCLSELVEDYLDFSIINGKILVQKSSETFK